MGVSNAIRFDSLLVRDLALELDARLAGLRLRALGLDREARRVHFRFDEFSLAWDLDPRRGGLARGPAARDAGNVTLAQDSAIQAVTAPADERIIEIALAVPAAATAGAARAVVIELVTHRWNAFVLGSGRRVLAILRAGESAARGLAPGDVYLPPQLSIRLGARAPLTLEEWLRLLLPSTPRERRSRALASVAWTSPINIDAILADAADTTDATALRDAWQRYVSLTSVTDREPCLLLDDEGAAQPYGVRVSPDALAEPGLLDAFEDALRRIGRVPPPAHGQLADEAADRVRGRIRQVDRRIERLRRELDGAPEEAATQRRQADLLMSQIHRMRRGDSTIELDDFNGRRVSIALDPALTPAENAARLYESARKRERAAATLPQLLERARHERERLDAMHTRIRAGEVDAAELQVVLGSTTAQKRGAREPARLPYRRYRTSGGLEVRVGRGSAANDALTFHHSSPDDVWLHARDVAGAHVILRWRERAANPPARDLQEAAVLAALHSRARTSGTVPVDWTRRKYVRKPRKSAPGRVAIERAGTLFVEPNEELELRLRWDPLDDILE